MDHSQPYRGLQIRKSRCLWPLSLTWHENLNWNCSQSILSPPLFFSSLAAPPAGSQVIQIQSDPLRKHKTQNKFRWTPRHNYPKSLLQQTFCSTHEHEPTKEDGCLSVFKYMLLLALLVVVLSSCDTSEPSYTKQSFMNAKEHSNTETLFQRNAEAFGLRKLHSQTNS